MIQIISCSRIGTDKSGTETTAYFEDIEKYQNVISTGELDQFEIELKTYLSYSSELFSIWNEFIKVTEPIINKFNNENNYDRKVLYAKELETYYGALFKKISILKPPEIAESAHKLALDTIKTRMEYVSAIENNDLNGIADSENKAYLSETMFWEEIDNIYKYFDNKSAELNLDNYTENIYLIED